MTTTDVPPTTVRTTQLVVALATYRRPDELRGLLPALVEQLADVADLVGTAGVLVVDNDPEASARTLLEEWSGTAVRYVHEPEPGIAAARNRALAEAGTSGTLVFIDDDEVPHPGWLRALLDTQAATGAAAVAGAVVSAYDGELLPWVAAGDFFRRRRLPTGTPIEVAATNNLLLDLAVVTRLGLRFDAAFGISGGSDTLFTRQLTRSGAPMVWCDEAVVTDRVPTARLTPRWVLARAYRLGNSATRVDLVLAGTPRERLQAQSRGLARGAVRVAGGSARALAGLVTGRPRHQARGLRTAARGLGMAAGTVGLVYQEYRRRS
ncbi:glycosyltransferase [Modestobacter sp. L9-4]|uniref:glycosyltransferase family 2 protein n=1 Tax=Modestobacter sp. L9-4 TaxID=2851567 RepID=UPI001C796043|nr:glycosyltransferase [Modestobacter sp. L9-4]QXG74977.1 glycosyltransferase [Modestobacter sp. L9-4]